MMLIQRENAAQCVNVVRSLAVAHDLHEVDINRRNDDRRARRALHDVGMAVKLFGSEEPELDALAEDGVCPLGKRRHSLLLLGWRNDDLPFGFEESG